MPKVNPSSWNKCHSPFVQQIELYESQDDHLYSTKDGGRIQRCLESTMSDSIVTQNYEARSNVLALKDITQTTKSLISHVTHSQRIV